LHAQRGGHTKPDSAEAHSALGYALGNRGDSAGAIAQLETAIRLKPDFEEAHFRLGVIRFLLAQFNSALTSLTERRGSSRNMLRPGLPWPRTPKDRKSRPRHSGTTPGSRSGTRDGGHSQCARRNPSGGWRSRGCHRRASDPLKIAPGLIEAHNGLVWLSFRSDAEAAIRSFGWF
jgi:tetratricopeptide (TPR) repeat protein